MKNRRLISIIALLLALVMSFSSCEFVNNIIGDIPSGGTVIPDGDGDDTQGDASGDTDGTVPDDGSKPEPDDGTTKPDDGDQKDDTNPTDPPTDDPINPPADDPVDPPVGGYDTPSGKEDNTEYPEDGENSPAIDSYEPIVTLPEFLGGYYTVLNGNRPYFLRSDLGRVPYAYYSELDTLGRAGMAVACLGPDLLPTGNRKDPNYNPTGWVQKTYTSDLVTGGQIWNRSHLIAWSLADESGKLNLVAGTPYFNQLGMTQFEDMVRDYIKETGNHVLYRVVPVFVGDELVCRGVTMEAFSIEDNGGLDTPEGSDGICFNVFMHNVNPGIDIDYATGNTSIADGYETEEPDLTDYTYIVNAKSHKIHLPECSGVASMSEANKIYSTKTLEEIIAEYEAKGIKWSYCGTCHPEKNHEP